MDLRYAVLLLGVLGCGARVAAPPPVTRTSILLPGPTVPADSLRVAATDSSSLATLALRSTVRLVSNRGALDFIDGGGDVLVTDRRAVIAYAASRTDYATLPLPWDRQYVVVAPETAPLHGLVDAVRVDARPAATSCQTDTAGDFDPWPRIAYAADDSTARALADRLMGLGVATRAVRAGAADSAYAIVTRPADSTTCDINGRHVVPLIDTRSTLIVRRGAIGVVADSAGHVRLTTAP